MPPEFTTLLIIVIGLAVLLLVIGVVLTLRARPSKSVPADQPAAEQSTTSNTESASKASPRPGKTNLPADAVVLMRDDASGSWIVNVNGMQYSTLKEVHDDRTASKLLEALGGLQLFAGITPGAPQPNPIGPPSPGTTNPNAEMNPMVAQALTQSDLPPSLPQYPAPPGSIVAQIETILQRNLGQHPELAARKIHVGAAPDSSLLIEVDRQIYHHVDELSDPAVRDLVKKSIQDWERTT